MLIGLQLYDADARTTRRQQLAVDALGRLNGVEALNVQFRDGAQAAFPRIETLAALSRDSNQVTSAPGRRKPLAREMFDVLAGQAAARGHRYFAFINADIVVTPEAIRQIDDHQRESYVVSRTDVDDLMDARPPFSPPMTAGLDMFVVSTAWWSLNRHRFRDYIVGETCWDNVYTAILMCHSKGIVLNREALILHERHTPAWHEPTPQARYNGMLAALDARYFSMWAEYWQRLESLRACGAGADEEGVLQREAFVWRPSAYQAARQAVRSLRARRGYRRLSAGWARSQV